MRDASRRPNANRFLRVESGLGELRVSGRRSFDWKGNLPAWRAHRAGRGIRLRGNGRRRSLGPYSQALPRRRSRALLGAGSGEPIEVTKHSVHDTLDLALLHTQSKLDHVLPVTFDDPAEWRLDRATVGGFSSKTEQCPVVRFMVGQVSELSSSSVVLDGKGFSGACAGDSGSPLMLRDRAGAVSLAAILSRGSASCDRLDEFVRLAAAADWLKAELPEVAAGSRACDGITDPGRCFGNQAVWCEGGSLRAEICADTSCGWSTASRGHRCGTSPACPGDEFGTCEGNASSSCKRGTVERSRCDTDHQCVIDALSGRAECQ